MRSTVLKYDVTNGIMIYVRSFDSYLYEEYVQFCINVWYISA